MKKGDRLLTVNIVSYALLTLLVIYDPTSTAHENTMFGLATWSIPVILIINTLIFYPNKLRGIKHTIINIGLVTISAILFLFPPQSSFVWWYPIGLAFLINTFVA